MEIKLQSSVDWEKIGERKCIHEKRVSSRSFEFEFATVKSLWTCSFAKWCESKRKVQSSIDWELNYKVVYIGKKTNRRESVFMKNNNKKCHILKHIYHMK